MIIVYFSKTGNIERFVNKIKKIDSKIKFINGNKVSKIKENYILLTYTINFGEVPNEVDKFLKNNNKNIKGIVGSGNKNWGIYYCNAANIISKKYNIPILMNFELAGNIHDINTFLLKYKNFLGENNEIYRIQ